MPIQDNKPVSPGLTSTDKPKVFVETYGCSFNVSDGEVMAGLLERDGFELTDSPDGADAVVVNSCTVKDRTWLDLKKRLNHLSDYTPAVILAGCAPKVPHQAEHLKEWSQIGPNNLAAISETVRSTLAGEHIRHLDVKHDDQRLLLPVRRRNSAVEIIPISKGCLGSCTFCQTVIARGRLRSFPADQILDRIRKAIDEGVNQVWLTSQDCGAYGLDIGTNLPTLLRQIVGIPGSFKVRVGMANPDLINLYKDEFAEVLSDQRFYQFAHIPLQSGSNSVLLDMRRLYTTEVFRTICKKLRSISPDITIATDIIVGFPTETESDFQRTLEVLAEIEIPVVNRSRYSPRPGTPAARMRLLPSDIVAERSKALYKHAADIAFKDLDHWTTWRGEVTIEERLTGRSAVLARNFAYKPIVLPEIEATGAIAQIDRRERFHLHGKILAKNR